MKRELTGWHVLGMFVLGFGTIIAVNTVLAVKAIQTFPGLETKNSYVASQRFDIERAAQEALGWTVSVDIDGDTLRLAFADANGPVKPEIEQAILGRATHAAADRTPEFHYDGTAFVAPVDLDPGTWDLRLVARAADGTTFRKRIALWVKG